MLLCDGQTEEFKRIYDFSRSVGLPVSLDEIEVTRDRIDELLPSVTSLSDIRHYPYAVTVEMLSKAFDDLEKTNRLAENRRELK
jgi:glycerol dehydrogenase